MAFKYKTRTKTEKRLFVKAFFENNPNSYSAEHFGMINGIPGSSMRRWLYDPSINVDHYKEWTTRDTPTCPNRKKDCYPLEDPDEDSAMVKFSPEPSETPVEIMQSVQTTKLDRAPINDISDVYTVSPFEMPEKPKKSKKTNSYGNRMRIEMNDVAIELPEGFRLQDLPLLISILRKAE